MTTGYVTFQQFHLGSHPCVLANTALILQLRFPSSFPFWFVLGLVCFLWSKGIWMVQVDSNLSWFGFRLETSPAVECWWQNAIPFTAFLLVTASLTSFISVCVWKNYWIQIAKCEEGAKLQVEHLYPIHSGSFRNVRVQRQVPLSPDLFPRSDQFPKEQQLVLDCAFSSYLCYCWPRWVSEHKYWGTRPSPGF